MQILIEECVSKIFSLCDKSEPALVNPSVMIVRAHHTLAHHTYILSGVSCFKRGDHVLLHTGRVSGFSSVSR